MRPPMNGSLGSALRASPIQSQRVPPPTVLSPVRAPAKGGWTSIGLPPGSDSPQNTPRSAVPQLVAPPVTGVQSRFRVQVARLGERGLDL